MGYPAWAAKTRNTTRQGRVCRGETRSGRAQPRKETIMLKWALILAIVAVIAGALGFTGIAGAAAGVAKILFFLFLVGFVLFAVLGVTVFKSVTK
jgi:uncharacterized membrane protein YtjA (UPF0391 family)